MADIDKALVRQCSLQYSTNGTVQQAKYADDTLFQEETCGSDPQTRIVKDHAKRDAVVCNWHCKWQQLPKSCIVFEEPVA